MFSSLAEIQVSQRVSEKGCRRKKCLWAPTPFSSYLMDQVFLQDSIPPRRHPTSSLHKRETTSQPPQTRTSLTMTNHGDDCYFYYYSTCSKGDSCPFRHCEAAMGNETVCNLWQEGRCFRTVCKFRHMEITKKRKEIPCYWENHPAGCQKPHCAFFHEKARYIDGTFVPPDKSQSKNEEQPHEEPAPPPPTPLPTAANPQLRGVIKTESQEPVPSPTHPPVVINPADDDEDEDDQFSEEGEDGKVSPSPRKLPKSDESLNFGVSTLEEIRLRKALKASMKRAGYPIQSADTSANGEKENIQSFFQPALYEARDAPPVFEEPGRPRGSVAERLGRKMPNADVKTEGVSLKKSLAERLGRVVDAEEPPQKALKPIKERLGLYADPIALTEAAGDANIGSKKSADQIRIKTLEEIRQERAAQSQSQKDSPSAAAPEITITKTTKGVKRAIAVKDDSIGHIKTFSEVLHAKKKREEQEQNPNPKKAKLTAEKAPGKIQGEPDAAEPVSEARKACEVRVKTLEEIRREKATRIRVQQALDAENKKSPDTENGAKKPRLLQVKKPAAQNLELLTVTSEKSAEVTEKPLKTPAAAAPPPPPQCITNNVKVKTFEEIMREKRLRKQEMEEKASSNSKDKAEAEGAPSQKLSTGCILKRKFPTKVTLTPPGSSSPSTTTSVVPDTTPSTPKVPVRKLIHLKSKAASRLNGTAAPGTAAGTSVPVKQSTSPQQTERESCSQSPSSSREVPDKNTSPAKPARAAPQGPTADKTLNNNHKKSPEHSTDTKVRPKLNVKPSVMKPAMQVKPGPKRRGAERSAVAAVKPLNSTSTVLEEPLQDTACRDRQVFLTSSAEAQLSSAVPHSPSTLLESGSSSSSLGEELQTVPVFKQSPSQETKPAAAAAARDTCTVPQSPLMKSPTQPKSRRPSAAVSRTASTSSTAASTSAVDDFEELINEFTDDHLEDDVDPAIGEDDLLQELSDMIDS
ncbi:hypothetical protein PAMP_017999 [Pampus punctatissimus]